MLSSMKREKHKLRRVIVHSLRVAMLVAALCLIRHANRNAVTQETVSLAENPVAMAAVAASFDEQHSICRLVSGQTWQSIVDVSGATVGSVQQTSPGSDHFIGYTGPTNCLVTMNEAESIVDVRILSSRDTKEHVDAIRDDGDFLDSFVGLKRDDLRWSNIDAVSGATLTSHAIKAAVELKVSGTATLQKFEPRPGMDAVQLLFPNVEKTELSEGAKWRVFDQSAKTVGYVIMTSPAGDSIVGYQGPTLALIGVDPNGLIIGVVVDKTFENLPYSHYLNDDAGFQKLFRGKSVTEVSVWEPMESGYEGVSGATMTSLAVAESVPLTAKEMFKSEDPMGWWAKVCSTRSLASYWPDLVTVGILGLGGVLLLMRSYFSRVTRNRFRVLYQFLLIIVIGFANGHLISQSLLAGWAANSIPWQVAPSLVALTVAAFLIPIFSRHQPWCQHLCPFGAMQQVIAKNTSWRIRISKRLSKFLKSIPSVLLLVTIVSAVAGSTSALSSIEPFHAFSWRVAGWVTIAIFIGGIVFSAFSPMAYCRFGCPTGAVINFVRFRADSHRLGMRDAVAGTLMLVAFGLQIFQV